MQEVEAEWRVIGKPTFIIAHVCITMYPPEFFVQYHR